VSQGQQVRRAPAPEPRQALTFRTDEGTMRRVRRLARELGVSTNEALNRLVRERLISDAAAEAARRSYRLTPEQERVVDAVLASIGAHTTGEDGT